MGGKGVRRREKNYKAAHGEGHARLPPPPNPSSIDALPSKLRKLMSLAGGVKQQLSHAKKNTGDGSDKAGARLGEGTDSMSAGMKRKRNDQTLMAQYKEHGDEAPDDGNSDKKKKKKRDGKKAVDLRFEELDKAVGSGSRRKERRKLLLERKKKRKKPREEEDTQFPGREEIKFGDVVQAPPKLVVPKAFKAARDASHERLRLQAVDAYRKRKGWESRPGVKLPAPVPML